VSITFPQARGYQYQEGGITSPDGHCRAFDARAQGTVFSSGLGVVVLKRLKDALADGDQIHAVIRGAALNNDGSSKVSFTAPSVNGHTEVIALAQAVAGVEPESISYVETHGTGTPLGDPIEIAGLTTAFRGGTTKKNFCAIGSVKTNIGHLDAAAGVAGLIKTTLALKHKQLPPSLHFTEPNPKLNLGDSPFFVNAKLREWPAGNGPRRAGVSSFGVGGTNAHAIVEEAPAVAVSGPSRAWQLLLLSARTPAALDRATANLHQHFAAHADLNLSDAAFTLQTGRAEFAHRRMLVCRDVTEAAKLLATPTNKQIATQHVESNDAPVVFIFPGQGAQYVNMGRELYASEEVFRAEVDRCAEILRPHLGMDLREIIFPAESALEDAKRQLGETRFTQPSLFVIEYALAKLWMSWGIQPQAMIGHSVGEYVAGCLAGVFSLEDALRLVAKRAALVQAQPRGSMLAVKLPLAELQPQLPDDLSIAAVNSPTLCVVSGPDEAVERFEKQLAEKKVTVRHLCTSHAFHSAMMEPVLAPFTALFDGVKLNPPQIPFVSNVTAQWVTTAQTTDPNYWASHLRQTVRFADGVGELVKEPDRILLEIGPGQSLSTMVRQHPARAREQVVLATLGVSQEEPSETKAMLQALGKLWLAGGAVDWNGFYAQEKRHRVSLPTYPFERQRFWAEPAAAPAAASVISGAACALEIAAPISGNSTSLPAAAPAAPAANVSRKEHLITLLRGHLHELSGMNLAEVAPATNFLELGFDSLFLTQASLSLQNKFGVRITFRQMLEELSSLEALADYLDQALAPDQFSPVMAQPVATPAAVTAISSAANDVTVIQAGSSLASFEQLLKQQLELSGQLLNLVQQNPAAAKTLASPATAVSVPPGSSMPPAQPKSDVKAFGPYKPIETAPGGGLTQRQRDYLDALIARYTARTQKSKQHTQKYRRRLADPRTVAGFRPFWKEMVYPLVMERSLGARMWDIDGNEYVDFTMGFGTNLLGHSPQFINDTIAGQLKKGLEVGPQTPLAGEVAELMCELTGMERCAFSNTGSEAVLAALRIARTVTGRNRIVYFTGDYHGIFDEVLQRPGGTGGVEQTFSIAPGIPPQQAGNVAILEYENPASLEYIRRHGSEIAAVIVEPVQSRHPDLQPAEFLRELRRVTHETGSALVFDEVITGFRSHPGGVQALFGIRADIATYGKLIGGGLPIGAVCGSAKFMDALDGGHWSYGDNSIPEAGVTFFAGTYVRHPLTIAASHAMLSHLKREGPELQRKLNERMAAVARELNHFLRERQVPVQIEQFSSLFWVRFDSKIKHSSLLFFLLRDRGVHIFEGRLFFLSTAHTEADVEFLIRAFKESILEMQVAGFLPETPTDIVQREIAVAAPAAPLVQTGPLPPTRRETTPAQPLAAPRAPMFVAAACREIKFSLYFFGNYPSAYSPDKYKLLIEGARFADEHGFTGIWIPERHFHPVGGFSPNPSVVAAAIARETKRLQLRGGSVVLPLHNPIRVAEEWSLVDNLSNGRVGIAIASGWHPNDFVFAPEAYEKRRELCTEGLELIRKLWRGQAIPVRGGANNPLEVSLYPMPVQRELPTWLTCVQKSSYVTAGELGTGVLAMATNQTIEEIAGKIAAYRESFAQHGHAPERAQVTLLLHTYVGDDFERTLAQARGPMCDYLRSYLDNSQKRHESKGGPLTVAKEDMDYLLNRSFDDYVKGKALIGTPESCARVVEKFREIGVDEIGCFIDFGVEPGKVLESLPHLCALKQRFEKTPAAPSLEPGRNGESLHRSEDKANEPRNLPLTESQQGLWAMILMTPAANRAYNEVTTLRLRGPVDLDALERSLQTLMDRHEALRTTIDKDGEFQTVHPRWKLELAQVDLSGLDETEQAARLRAEFAQVENFAFDFQRGSAMRALVIRLAGEQHLLLLSFHHLFGNGPSFVAAFGELCSLYAAITAGGSLELGPAMQLSDYVRWQGEQSQSGATATDEAFWVKHLTGIPAGLDLPTDRPRPPLTTYRGGRLSMKLDRELTGRVRKAGAGLRSSMFMTLFAAHNVWLHRLSGQDDLVVGVPFEGPVRSLPGGSSLFANTTNMMPLRSRIGERTTFAELVAATKSAVLEANEHQNFFFGRLIEKLNLRHDLSRPPVFSASFNYESGKFQKQIGGLNVELALDGVPFGSPPDTAKFDLGINVAEKDGELQFDCNFNADLFDEATIRRWLEYERILCEGIAANVHQSIWSLPMLNERERRQILVEWNATDQAVPRDQFLDTLFEAQAARSPGAVAVEFAGQTLTYAELEKRSNQFAHRLRQQGVGPDVLVAVCAKRSLELVVGLLGVLKAGGAYVPIDPDYPRERQAFMLADGNVPVVLTQTELVKDLPPTSAYLMCLDQDFPPARGVPDTKPGFARGSESLAYVIYTSGSTGQPKGVMISHRAVVNFLVSMIQTPGISADDSLLAVTSLSFDIAALEIFLPLVSGAKVILASREQATDGRGLLALLKASRPTMMQATPATWRMLIEAGWERGSLRKILCGGEALSVELAARLGERSEEVWNMYGPTETTIWSTLAKISTDEPICIGRPIGNTQIYILDRHGGPVPPGVAGELCIGGNGLARGYLRRAALTAEKFLPNPFGHEPGARIYRTGDLARYRMDQTIECIGRLDHQVKIRGFRIELGEIESVLVQHPAVQEAVVIAREDTPGDNKLIAYLVARNDPTPSSQELRRLVEGKLPAYMVPATFVFLAAMPLTPNGKVDRRALPAPPSAGDDIAKEFIPPRTPVEELLAGIWSEVLKVKPVGRHDTFFELGGHSLLAAQIISRIRTTFAVELPMRTLFEKPGLADLAACITADGPQAANLSFTQIRPGASGAERPLSHAQQQLWLLHQLMPASAAYNMFDAVRLCGALDLPALKWSLNEIVRRNEVLRLTITEDEGNPISVIHPAGEVQLEILDLSALPGAARAAEARRLAAEESSRPFDLAQGPLFRVKLLRLDESEHVLLVNLHHIVADGASIGLFFDELRQLYAANIRGEASPLAEPPVQYADFAAWQREWLQGEFLEKQLAYWTRQLAGPLPVLDLPSDLPRPRQSSEAGGAQSLHISPALTAALKTLCQQEKVTPFMLLLAAFQTLLHRYTGQEDIVVSSPMANRNRREIEELIGCFINTLVLRVNLGGDPTFRDLLKRVREVSLAAHAHQDLPFEKLVQALQPDRDPGRSPLTQVMFALQNALASPRTLAGLEVIPFEVEVKTAKLDLTLDLVDAGDGFQGLIEYRTDLFDAATITRMAEHFLVLLGGIVEDSTRRLSELPLLPPAERERLLVEWNETRLAARADQCVHELFEAQAAKNPDAIAAQFENQRLTYGELNTRANHLAHHLIQRGVGPETLVGIGLDRSLELLVALLGVLKAGGAYVPLDPDYPEQRLRYLQEDARVSVLLTSAKLRNFLPASSVPVVLLDSDWDTIARASGENPARRARPDNVAYVIYTSGSTGKPKGVLVPHRALANHNAAVIHTYALHPDDRVLQFASLSFDVAAEEIFPTLLAGACVVLRTDRYVASQADFLREVAAARVTVLNLPTAFWQLLVQALSAGAEQLPESVRLVIVGGEKIPTAAYQAWTKRVNPRVRWLNGYGPTETTVTATVFEPSAAGQLPLASAVVPIGRPLGNTLAYVLDLHGQPVPIGVPGELYLGGAGVARGYLRRPDLTGEKFVANPFVNDPAARLYRTGDRVRYRSDGNLEFLGRLDHQVKIRGYRIELGEIESALREHPAVRDALVIVREDAHGENMLVAYAIAARPEMPPAGEVRAFLKQHLPDHMLPAALVWLEKFPTTPNGKVDARALPPPDQSGVEEKNFVAPRTAMETTLADIWAEVLKIERVGVESDFFELGGHSLLAMQVISRANRALNLQLPMLALFEHPTVAALALFITHSQLELVGSEQLEALLREVEADTKNLDPSGAAKH
ncbi:MAG: amino acid adenylation domain-containing protein, partial [Verrucomicrobia bacterium]|nr:amino acid adenylation domain-containing protein [Verrucomicrobiota bacterium]